MTPSVVSLQGVRTSATGIVLLQAILNFLDLVIISILTESLRTTDPDEENHLLVNRFIQLCGAAQVPTELGGTRVVRRKRSVNATSRIIPIHQSFESSSGQIENTDLAFGKKKTAK